MFRGVIVLGCSLLSWAGSQQLDKFVSLVGSFAWYVFSSLLIYTVPISDLPTFALSHLRCRPDAQAELTAQHPPMLHLPPSPPSPGVRQDPQGQIPRYQPYHLWSRHLPVYDRADSSEPVRSGRAAAYVWEVHSAQVSWAGRWARGRQSERWGSWDPARMWDMGDNGSRWRSRGCEGRLRDSGCEGWVEEMEWEPSI